MSSVFVVLLLCVLRLNSNVAVNHWELTSDGSIQPQVDVHFILYLKSFNPHLSSHWNQQVDSIFYLRRPDDLVAFLHQFDYRQTINAINAQLLALQMEITEKVQQSTFLYVL